LNYLTTRRLFKDAANDNISDFSVKLSSGSTIKVHSLILSTKSDVLANMINGDFKEKDEKTLQFPTFSDDAVEKFIKFLYGFELCKDDVDLDIAKELVQIGGMYNVMSLSDAAGVVIKDLLTKENVFDLWKLSQEVNALSLRDKCGEFIVDNFDRKILLQDAKIKELPELSFWILNFDCFKKDKSVIRFTAPRTYVSFNKECSVQTSIEFNTNSMIKVTGVGVSILPGSSVTIELEMGEFVHKTEIVNNTNIDCVPVMFKDESKGNYTHVVKVSVTGSGAGISCSMDHRIKEGIPDRYRIDTYEFKKTVMCTDVCGRCKESVTFKFTKIPGSSIIQEIYFKRI